MKRPPTVSNSALIFLRHNQVDVFHENSQSIEDNTKSKTTRLFLVLWCVEIKQNKKQKSIWSIWTFLYSCLVVVSIQLAQWECAWLANIFRPHWIFPVTYIQSQCVTPLISVLHCTNMWLSYNTSLNILNTIRSQVKTIQSRSQFYFYYILFNIYWKCSSFPRTQWNFMLLNWFSHLCKCTETPSDWIYVKFINNIFIKGLYSISFEFWSFLWQSSRVDALQHQTRFCSTVVGCNQRQNISHNTLWCPLLLCHSHTNHFIC